MADSLPDARADSLESELQTLRAEHRRNKLALDVQRQREQLRLADLLAGGAAHSARMAHTSSPPRQSDALEYNYYDPSNYVNISDYLGDGPYGYSLINTPWLATRADRDLGRNRPIFQTETDLMAFRGMARLLAAYNANAIGAIENMTSYVVGKGVKCLAQHHPHCGLDASSTKFIVSQVDRIIDCFIERNDWTTELGEEKFQRAHIDGEFFEGLWHVGEGYVDVRIVEPEQTTQPYAHREIEEWIGCDHRRVDWTFGVCADDEDSQNVHGYYVQWTNRDTDWDFLPGGREPFYAPDSQNSWCQHFKSNVPRNVKRGLTDFICLQELLNLARKVLKNMGTATSLSAAIAWVIQYAPGILTSQIQSMIQANSMTSFTQNTQQSSRTNYVQQYNGGTVLHTPQNQEYKNAPGADNAPNYINVVEAMLRSCAVRWSMPEHMITGSAENNNYASILEAGSPFVKRATRWQARHVNHDKRVLWKVVEWNCQIGKIRDRAGRPLSYEEVRRLVTIEVEPSRVEVRDDGVETTRNETLKKNGVLSRKTWAAREGLDFEQEAANGLVDEAGQAAQQQQSQQLSEAKQDEGHIQTESLESIQHAPAGEDTHIGGKTFKPGMFIPDADMAKATPAEIATLKKQQREAEKSANRERKGTTFVSPNRSTGTSFADAIKMARSKEARESRLHVASVTSEVAKVTGTYQGIGSWKDGAEPTFIFHLKGIRDFNELKYIAAWQGLLLEQKASLAFLHDSEQGKNLLWTASLPGTIKEVEATLNSSRLAKTPRTISQPSEGLVIVQFFDPHGTPKFIDRLGEWSQNNGGKVTATLGHGRIIPGGAANRSESFDNFRAIIRGYEEVVPHDHIVRSAWARDMLRGGIAGARLRGRRRRPGLDGQGHPGDTTESLRESSRELLIKAIDTIWGEGGEYP